MKRTVSAVAVSGLALAIGLVATPATATSSAGSAPQGMVFVQNDDPAGNQVVAAHLRQDSANPLRSQRGQQHRDCVRRRR